MTRFHRAAFVIVLLALLASCSGTDTLLINEGQSIAAAQAETLPVSATPTVTPEPTETNTPTSTPEPTATLTLTPLPTDTPQVTLTPSPTLPPTATYPPPPEEVNIPILMYHYISAIPADADRYRLDLTVTPAKFEEQLQYLQAQGYQSIFLRDIYAHLSTGKPLPENPIVLTFDDGYKDAYTEALPLLLAYGFAGEFFVLSTPAHFEATQYMTWNEMKALSDAGQSLQPHGRDHYDLTNRDYDFLVYQILGAREAVEAHTGKPVTFFCYPSGRYDANTRAVVEGAGYLGAVTTEWGTTLRLDNRFTWPRVRIKGAWSIEDYASVLDSLQRERSR